MVFYLQAILIKSMIVTHGLLYFRDGVDWGLHNVHLIFAWGTHMTSRWQDTSVNNTWLLVVYSGMWKILHRCVIYLLCNMGLIIWEWLRLLQPIGVTEKYTIPVWITQKSIFLAFFMTDHNQCICTHLDKDISWVVSVTHIKLLVSKLQT